jgi:hypothetical protein
MAQGLLTRWPVDELARIGQADGLHIAALQDDGVTYRAPTWIWSVAVDGDLYVRAYNGKKSRWYRAATRRRAGRIMAAGMIFDARFEPVDGSINDRIDKAYGAKYCGSPYLQS